MTGTAPHAQQTPYAGCVDGVPVETAPHVLVSGPTGRGKTTRVLGIGALLWRGPRVLVSSKTDFMKLTIGRGLAERGPVYVMDLAAEIDPDAEWLRGVEYTPVVSDPTELVTNDDDAIAMASLLMQTASLVGSAGSGGGDDAFWQTISTRPLATLLQAGKRSGEGIGWTVRACEQIELRDGEDKMDAADRSPSWANAFELVEHESFHASALASASQMDGKLRDSITATMTNGLAAWTLSTVRGDGRARPFTPSMLEGPGEPTLYIVLPADSLAPPAGVAVIETIIRHWRRGVDRGLDRVLLSIDEFCNVAPIPLIDRYLSEARGLGVACVLAIQSSQQLYDRFGESKGRVIREVAPAILILEGAAEFDVLENASKWAGEQDVWRETIDASQQVSRSAERAPRRTVAELLPRSVEEGRLLLYGQEGRLVELPGIWQYD